MQVLIVLRDDRTGLLEETITVERPVSTAAEGEKARAVADALSQALHAGVVRVADDVVRKLSDTAPHATRGR
ncbi:MAG: hypothetical protein ACJ79V_08505 [Myxococcales bacterium]